MPGDADCVICHPDKYDENPDANWFILCPDCMSRFIYTAPDLTDPVEWVRQEVEAAKLRQAGNSV